LSIVKLLVVIYTRITVPVLSKRLLQRYVALFDYTSDILDDRGKGALYDGRG
jgi:hypothetical protein